MNERTSWYKIAPLTIAVTLAFWLGGGANYSTIDRNDYSPSENNNSQKQEIREKDKGLSKKLISIPEKTSF